MRRQGQYQGSRKGGRKKSRRTKNMRERALGRLGEDTLAIEGARRVEERRI
jgi:hypothetical protein